MRKREDRRADQPNQDEGYANRDREDETALPCLDTGRLCDKGGEETAEQDPCDDEDDDAGFRGGVDGAEASVEGAALDAADDAEDEGDEGESGEEVEDHGVEDVSAGAWGGVAVVAAGGTIAELLLA